MIAWLFGGSALAQIVLFLLVALGAGGAVLAAKALYDRNRRKEGEQAIRDQLQKEELDARKRMDEAADDYRRDGTSDRLRRHEF